MTLVLLFLYGDDNVKRLIKKSEIDYSNFMVNLLYDNIYDQNQIQEIINTNNDCLYSGEAYRIFYFDSKEEIIPNRDNYIKKL
jgi:hypothetical protein